MPRHPAPPRRPADRPRLGLLAALLPVALAACGDGGPQKTEVMDRKRRLSDAESTGPAGAGAAGPSAASAPGAAKDPAINPAIDPEDPELRAPTVAPMSPVGTRAAAVRCQAALSPADELFSEDWYTFSDADNPGTAVTGCDRGMSPSLLEVLPWGEGRTELCSIRWTAELSPPAKSPFAGFGVLLRKQRAPDLRSVVIETRSTTPVDLHADFLMNHQMNLPCGDERGGAWSQPVRCDGSGEWKRQELRLDKLKPRWGKPGSLSPGDVAAMHFVSAASALGPTGCDVRILEVRAGAPAATPAAAGAPR